MSAVTSTMPQPDDATAIGARIRSLRKDTGMTLSELATRASVSKSYLSTVENGTGTRPGVAVLHKLATALGVTLADLMGRQVHAEEPTEIPASLRTFAKEANLPAADLEMLAGIKFRGEAPRTAQRWQFIYDAIVLSGKAERTDD